MTDQLKPVTLTATWPSDFDSFKEEYKTNDEGIAHYSIETINEDLTEGFFWNQENRYTKNILPNLPEHSDKELLISHLSELEMSEFVNISRCRCNLKSHWIISHIPTGWKWSGDLLDSIKNKNYVPSEDFCRDVLGISLSSYPVCFSHKLEKIYINQEKKIANEWARSIIKEVDDDIIARFLKLSATKFSDDSDYNSRSKNKKNRIR